MDTGSDRAGLATTTTTPSITTPPTPSSSTSTSFSGAQDLPFPGPSSSSNDNAASHSDNITTTTTTPGDHPAPAAPSVNTILAPPRTTSLPTSTGMGQSLGRSSHAQLPPPPPPSPPATSSSTQQHHPSPSPSPSPSPVPPAKGPGLTASSRLKRVLAGRSGRKKQYDESSTSALLYGIPVGGAVGMGGSFDEFGVTAAGPELHLQQLQLQLQGGPPPLPKQKSPQPHHHHRVETNQSLSSVAPQMVSVGGPPLTFPGPSNGGYAHGHGHGHTKNLSAFATQVFNSVGGARKQTSKASLQPSQPSPPLHPPPMLVQRELPPLPPPPEYAPPIPAAISITGSAARGSEAQPQPRVDRPLPSPVIPVTLPLQVQVVESVDNRSSIIPVSPEMSSAVNYLRMADGGASAGGVKEGEGETVVLRARERRSGEAGEIKDTWRKSDSTIGQHTIRPGIGSPRPSRPVSMAESLQSTHTIVPVNQRQSLLTDDPDFGMPEEDDSDRSESVLTSDLPPRTPEKDVYFDALSTLQQESSPVSAKNRNRRSVSLSVTTQAILSKSKFLRTPSSAAPVRHHYPQDGSHVLPPSLSREGHHVASLSMSVQSHGHNANSRTRLVNMSTPSSAHQHSQSINIAHNPYTRFPEPPASEPRAPSRLDRGLPATPSPSPSKSPPISGQLRQTAVSITGGLAPAAGLAKRAVEKMGRAWGINTSQSISTPGHMLNATNAPSSYPGNSASSPSHPLRKYGQMKEQRGSNHRLDEITRASSTPPLADHQHHHKKGVRLRRTPNAPSISSTHSSTSVSDSEPFGAPVGPVVGKRLRPPLRTKSDGNPGSGLVFGRELRSVVRDTGVGAETQRKSVDENDNADDHDLGREFKEADERGDASGAENGEAVELQKAQLQALEERKLPALVVRCAQHILIWGIQEEGLFRVTGRPSHVSKLRAEFDSGGDFDMTESGPADLDPHAVSSLFKAFLRELPEPVLTHALAPYFDAAMSQESANNEGGEVPSFGIASRGPGLPSNPRDGVSLAALRKPPSLSTLAMPSLTGMRPPSKSLLKALQALLSKLPEENRDLIRTVTELIRATARESKNTKMPLSNLLLVFCPSLNMSPPLLKVLCEGEGIWEEEEVILDIRRQTKILENRESDPEDDEVYEDAKEGLEEEESIGRRSEEKPDSVAYHGSIEDSEERSMDDSSSMSQPLGSFNGTSLRDDGSSYVSTLEDQDTSSRDYRVNSPALLTSSAESLDTPESTGHLPFSRPLVKDDASTKDSFQQYTSIPVIADPSPTGLSSDHRPVIGYPIPKTGVLQFPSSGADPLSPPADGEKRRSVPILSLPSFAIAPTRNQDQSPPNTAATHPKPAKKKPSLQMLFSKKSSSSSLSSQKPTSSPTSRLVISGPYPQAKRTSSDSSASTPVSAVTALQSSTSILPPKLEMAIKNSPLKFGLGMDLPTVNAEDEATQNARPALAISTIPAAASTSTASLSSPGQTPIADYYQRSPSPSTSLSTESKWSLVSHPSPETRTAVSTSHLRPTLMRAHLSAARDPSSNHLGLLPEQEPAEDWTRTVLLAADVENGWTIAGSAKSA